MATAEQMQEAHSNADSSYRGAGEPGAIRISPSSDSRTREKRIDSDSGNNANEPWRRHGRYEGIGQPFLWKGSADQDFAEWSHKVCTFMLARFGDDVVTALTWAAQQRKIVAKTCVASQRNRLVPWITVFREQAGEDEIENIDDFVGKLYAYLVSFSTDAANRIVRNSGEGNGLEAWRRLNSEYDPTSSMRRVAILQQVQNPPRCQRVEDVGPALEEWLSKKRQYEAFTDRNGRPLPGIRRQPCGGHVPVDAKEPGGDCDVRQRGRGLPGVVRQTAGLQQHETVNRNEREQEDNEER